MINIPKTISFRQAKDLIRRMPIAEKIKLTRALQKETSALEFNALLRRIDSRRKKFPLTRKQIKEITENARQEFHVQRHH